ncbi:ABC transporter ATP-binding protein [Mangrovibacillus cuniculi]|uniref:Dipeptide ABC transporter ATP-binding protein n=1 Tax=Mangrovibacillus cuniculi TaxID=2593652 RepID=A0A7S8HEJ0_9BACI|nr:dipeptide ABC transporter ATP-binding protein [Mangrovibacillus cuniculi]QPC45788.1 dipeptide ABC transporter ATP-binding protein [Mangrovibacillus cuniculi]
MSKTPLLTVRELTKHFPITGGILGKTIGQVQAVNHVSFDVYKGETFSLVGESGCGKSTTGRALLRLHEPTSGEIIFRDANLTDLKELEVRRMRRDMQMVFQDPYASLNPRHTIGKILEEPLIVHKIYDTAKERKEAVAKILETVGLRREHASRYPHQFSGGQRQRIGIARALMTKPKLIVLDEPVSALDVSIQAQILNLLEDLQQEFDLTYVFIAHDLGVVRHISDRVGVMYLGNLVELSGAEELYASPLHPYTQALLSSVPIPDPTVRNERKRVTIKGDIPSASNPPSGCVFHTRCPLATERCKKEIPSFREVKDRHYVACHEVN